MSVAEKVTKERLAVALAANRERVSIRIEAAEMPALSYILPALHNMGIFVERQIDGADTHRSTAAASELILDAESSRKLGLAADRNALCDLLGKLFTGEAEDGRLNGLAVVAGLSAREIMLVRAYASYLRQAGVRFSLRYMADCLRRHPEAIHAWGEVFYAKFDPRLDGGARAAETIAAKERFELALAQVRHPDSEEILRKLHEVLDATVRTTFFIGWEPYRLPIYIALKLCGERIAFLPKPRPYREVYVFSQRFEGVHLRGGPLARGGLRWSDRMEDFRTEVLGLVKAQMVKNAIIVPTGAKGGFVCKAVPELATRDDVASEGVAVYELFINALLDVSDNLQAGAIVHHKEVVRHDGDDAYLVVAADKGTATFSDRANAIALARGFWLGDAFASGGSNGYDHKKLGITAKGAWETAKIRFSEIGLDWRSERFTAVGVGDMGGDVFGNGALLMPSMCLLAAFDHRHIFLDPNPDLAVAYAERKRLFALPRSSWDDYRREAISQGGGVWSRQERTIRLSPPIRTALATEQTEVTPDELIRIILRAPVTVFYNGGIGTFVKSSGESHDDVRDRASDSIRVNASDLRCKIVVEGGNLGLTQKARIEFALSGGLVYTDAIDNSAGVDCSDHEVNLKILLDQSTDDSSPGERRNQLLASMAPDVERLVLNNNAGQARRLARELHGIGCDAVRAKALLAFLESHAGLDRQLENLPSDDVIEQRAANGLACLVLPELSVVLAYAKLSLKTACLSAPHQDEPWSLSFYSSYFPPAVRAETLASHPLRAQITATLTANECVNRAGLDFSHRIASCYGVPVDRVLNAFAFVFTAFGLDGVCRRWDGAIGMTDRSLRDEFDRKLEEIIEIAVVSVLNRPRYLTTHGWRVISDAIQSLSRGMPAEDAAAPDVKGAIRHITLLREAVNQVTYALRLISRHQADSAAILATLRMVGEETGLQPLIALLEGVRITGNGNRTIEFAVSALRQQLVHLTERTLGFEDSVAPDPRDTKSILAGQLRRMGFEDMRVEISRLHGQFGQTLSSEETAYQVWQLAQRMEEAREYAYVE